MKRFVNSVKVGLLAGSVAVSSVSTLQNSDVAFSFGKNTGIFFYLFEFFRYFFYDCEGCKNFSDYINKRKFYAFIGKLKGIFGEVDEWKRSGETFSGKVGYNKKAVFASEVWLVPHYSTGGYSCDVTFFGKTYQVKDEEKDIEKIKSEFCKLSRIYEKFSKEFIGFGKYVEINNLCNNKPKSITFETFNFRVNIQGEERSLKKVVYNPFMQTLVFWAKGEESFSFYLSDEAQEKEAFELLHEVYSKTVEEVKIQREIFEKKRSNFIEAKEELEKIVYSKGFKVEVDGEKKLEYVISNSVCGFKVKIKCSFPPGSSFLQCYFFVNGHKVENLASRSLSKVEFTVNRLKYSLDSYSKYLKIFKNLESQGIFAISGSKKAFEFIITPRKDFNIISRDTDESFSLSKIIYKGSNSTALLYSKDYYDGEINFDSYDLRNGKEKKKFFKLFNRGNSVEKFFEQWENSEDF